MQLISVNSDILKLGIEPNTEQALIGSLIKTFDNSNDGVVSQIFSIESSPDPYFQSIAISKILFTHTKTGMWKNWTGNIPAKTYVSEKISLEELISNINNSLNPVNFGSLSHYGNKLIALSQDGFNTQNAVFYENKNEAIKFVEFFTSKINKKILLIDYSGEFTGMSNAITIKAGSEFKLPLNSKGIDIIYEKGLSEASVETKAVIEDVFLEVQNYIDSSEAGFIPFSSFKSVVEDEYKQSSITELVLLKNKLIKYNKQGIFANTKNEIDALPAKIKEHNVVILDLSEIPSEWHKDYTDFVVNSNIKNRQTDFYLALEADDKVIDTDLLSTLLVKGAKNGVIPVVFSDYQSPLRQLLTKYAENIVFLRTRYDLTSNFPYYSSLIKKLGEKEFIIAGKATNFIPLFMSTAESFIQEDPLTTELPQKVEKEENKVHEIIENSEDDTENFYEEGYDQNTTYEEDNETMITESSDQEIVEYNEDFNYDFSEEDLDHISINTKQEANNIENMDYTMPDTISEDVETLYTAQKEEPVTFHEENIEYEEEEDTSTESNIPIFKTNYDEGYSNINFKEGDTVQHQKYGIGTVKKIISYGNKKLCSIHFKKVGRRLLDPELAVIEKVG
jgi:hypothetical protein